MTVPDADDLQSRLERWRATISDCSYYEILGLLEIADEAAVKKAYRDFVRSFHPDAHPSESREVLASLTAIFERGVEAYQALVDPASRARYDMALAQGYLRLDPSSGRSLPPSVKSLDELCSTLSGKRAAARADQLISEGELFEAQRQLKAALIHEGGDNAELEGRLDALDLALFAKGE